MQRILPRRPRYSRVRSILLRSACADAALVVLEVRFRSSPRRRCAVPGMPAVPALCLAPCLPAGVGSFPFLRARPGLQQDILHRAHLTGRTVRCPAQSPRPRLLSPHFVRPGQARSLAQYAVITQCEVSYFRTKSSLGQGRAGDGGARLHSDCSFLVVGLARLLKFVNAVHNRAPASLARRCQARHSRTFATVRLCNCATLHLCIFASFGCERGDALHGTHTVRALARLGLCSSSVRQG